DRDDLHIGVVMIRAEKSRDRVTRTHVLSVRADDELSNLTAVRGDGNHAVVTGGTSRSRLLNSLHPLGRRRREDVVLRARVVFEDSPSALRRDVDLLAVVQGRHRTLHLSVAWLRAHR